MAAPQMTASDNDDQIDLREYWDLIVDSRWFIASLTALSLSVGVAYAFLARPIYEANLLIQVEDSAGSAASFLGQAASLFDVKTPAAGEIEIIRSRMIIGEAVDKTLMYVQAKPRYVPLVGGILARNTKALSEPGFLGFAGYVSGSESIQIGSFTVPEEFEASKFRLRVLSSGRFSVTHPDLEAEIQGAVGVPATQETPDGTISLLVGSISAKPGAEFTVVRNSREETIADLQEDLKLTEKGRQSGVIEARLEGADKEKLIQLLNEIGGQYVRQNVERKAAEAEKTLAFLDAQLPQFKKQLMDAEDAFNRYRNRQGTVALDEEAKLILSRTVDLQGKLLEAQQKRKELVSRFTPEHPLVATLDSQISAFNVEIAALNAKVHTLPLVQQDALRLERDVKVNNELYQQLRNNAMQLQLMREGKIGNVRLVDRAALPKDPIRPRRALVIVLSLLLGFVGAVLVAIARNAFFRGIRNPEEIEAHAGLTVYSTVPLSKVQAGLAQKVTSKEPGTHVLACEAPHDSAVESLRSLRTALQFAMLDAPNNRIVITGASPGVGKSFISTNFAAVVASSGKRVLLIDADLRKGYLNSYFGLPRERGLSELIAGSVAESEAIHRNVAPHLDMLTTGVLPPNPAELLMTQSFSTLLVRLSSMYDVVIIDTPPILAAADTLNISFHAGTLLLVARAGQSLVGELHESAKRLSHSGRTVTGAILNALDASRRHMGAYGYKYGGYKYRQYSYEATSR
ncbi:polysaccharide biosynthesis tyrosine autokinase [Ramlibacter alkalitolerans]|nr:polysaccharide biosynthesis tyrosine autokinase [Ramlibacter alkalitolerans]